MAITNHKQLFDSKQFQSQFHTDAPLGAFCSDSGTLFRLWAPTAQQVTLSLYTAGNGCDATETVLCVPGEKGTWEYRAQRNLDGWYYDYEVSVDGVNYRTQDPYAKACGVNGKRSMVLDLRRTDPAGWELDAAPAPTAEQVIYELHIKDFSWDRAGGFDAADRGKYTAFLRTGTTLDGDGIHATGLDYLKRLGVTHIQILPMYDYGSVDEEDPDNGYNWGYDPVNYNIPEGSYCSDPYHGEVRIRQMKEMIASLHAHGFRVIMDVVYNHTYDLDCGLYKTAPWYYYRQKTDGTPANGSGCGNDVATERSMVSRYIKESVLYWVREYHIDGFRFDLMGLMDADLMNEIRKSLDETYGRGEKLVYGEPWRADNTAERPGTVLCDKSNLKKLDIEIGAFCDDVRDAVKGKIMDIEAVGFVNGGEVDAAVVKACVAGWSGEGYPNQAPSQNITYLSCHDDWTLWDKLVYTMDPKKNFTGSAPDILQSNRLASAINFCCQGRPFFLSGEEFGRTKGGIKNSYCSSAEINQLDWNRAWENWELVDYYRGLISLRQQLPGLQDKSIHAAKRVLFAENAAPNCVTVRLDNRGEGSRWEEIDMIFNCSQQKQTVKLPEGTWQVLVDGDSSFRWQEHQMLTKTCALPPMTACILGK